MNEIMTGASIIIQLVAMIIAGTWAVSAIRSTTVQLTSTIDALEKTVSKLATTIDKIETKAIDHEVRIIRLEDRNRPRHDHDCDHHTH